MIWGYMRGNVIRNLSAGYGLDDIQGAVRLDGICDFKDETVAGNHGLFGLGYAQMVQQVGHGGLIGQVNGHTLLGIIFGYIIP
jgi:hypothetical protein